MDCDTAAPDPDDSALIFREKLAVTFSKPPEVLEQLVSTVIANVFPVNSNKGLIEEMALDEKMR